VRILVLAHQLRAGGGKVTCINLLKSILTIDNQNTYYLVVPDDPDYRELRLEDTVKEVRYYKGKFGYPGLVLFDVITRHLYVREFKPDLIWAMGGFGLHHPPCSQAVSVQYPHLMYENEEMEWIDWFTKIKLSYLRYQFKTQLPKTDLVIFQTQTMEARCLGKYQYCGRTLVTYKGISGFLDPRDSSMPPALQPLGDKFKLFYLTRYYPHKGLEILVELMDQYRDVLPDVVLVITIEAKQHGNARQLLAEIEGKGLQDRVVNAGYLKQSQLAGFFRSCDCLVMPTRLESFSGTYLEAMHYGIPILTSDLDFAREICGPAALYFDPRNGDSIKEAVLRLKRDPQLRRDLVTSGKKRLADQMDLTWDEIAKKILAEFDEMV